MSYELKVNRVEGIIEVRSFGKENLNSLKKQLDEIIQLSEQENIFKVLVDTTDLEMLSSVTDIFTFMSDLPRKMKYATYSNQGQKVINDLKFAETVSVNRGINVRHLMSKEEALKFLHN